MSANQTPRPQHFHLRTSAQADAPQSADSRDPLRLLVISGSAREPRTGPAIADWVHDQLAGQPEIAAESIDLGAVDLPGHADLRPGGGAAGVLAERIAEADGYLVITPEYNHSFPAPLKQLIDGHYNEWMFKPAMLLSYGVTGGVLAAEQLRGVFSELHVVTTRKVVSIPAPWTRMDGAGFRPDVDVRRCFDVAISELFWWATALKRQRAAAPYQAA